MNKREYAKLKRWLSRQSDMLEMICSERGIKLWEEYAEKKGSNDRWNDTHQM